MQGLSIRIARRLNKKLERRGKLFAARYHERILRTPTETRRALICVLGNARRHAGERITARDWIGPLLSAPGVDGCRTRPRAPCFLAPGMPPQVPAGPRF